MPFRAFSAVPEPKMNISSKFDQIYLPIIEAAMTIQSSKVAIITGSGQGYRPRHGTPVGSGWMDNRDQ
jgi:hypothetical protein